MRPTTPALEPTVRSTGGGAERGGYRGGFWGSPARFLTLFVTLSMIATLVPVGEPPASSTVAPRASVAKTSHSIIYVHDAAGRLLAAIDPATSTAVYAYDPAGNIQSVTRHPSSSLSVLQISPVRWPARNVGQHLGDGVRRHTCR